jgi:lipoprotein-releasing system ATP-binding protein
MSKPVIQAAGLCKTYTDLDVPVLTGIDLTVQRGEKMAIVGTSGSGKSTLMHLLGSLDAPSSGSVSIDGVDPLKLGENERSRLRNEKLGFVYQFHHLLPEFTALENIAMPLRIRRMAKKEAEERAGVVLDQVGLGHRVEHKPGELSGGERQRAAIARALVTEPLCVLADEPTGNLDRHTADSIFQLMLDLNDRRGTALIIVTHDQELAARTGRVMTLREGRLNQG